MGKKKQERKRLQKMHADRMMEEMIEHGESPRDRHVIPVQQSGHIAHAYCWCAPEVTYEHPINFKRVYSHRFIVH